MSDGPIVIRSARKTVGLRVRPDGRLEVRAPLQMTDDEIRRLLERHRQWIAKHTARRAERQPSWTDAERRAMAETLRQALPGIVNDFARRLGLWPARVTIRCQKSRWGSCSAKGNLNFNCLLAAAPDHVRRYVVLHELCHLKYMNHSRDFWALVASQMPDYAAAKAWLKGEGQRLIDRLST